MKKIKLITLLLLTAICFSCSKYDDSELRGRVESLESWQKTVNGQITALQGLVTAMEKNDYITAVNELPDKSGYTITFSKSGAITIKHGQNGADATAPVVGVKKDEDGKYYWTLNGSYILSGSDKIPTTGGDGVTPQVRVNTTTQMWEISTDSGTTWTSTGVKATGEKGDAGDAIFANGGVDISDSNNVTFTLSDGTKIILPRYIALRIGDDNLTDVLSIIGATDIALVLPTNFKESDYSAIVAEVKTNSGTSTDIKTKAMSNTLWSVEVTKPTFTGGVCNNDARIKVTPTFEDLGENAVLKVTIINSNGNELVSSRAIKFTGMVIANAGGELETKISAPNNVKYMKVTGTMLPVDFEFIRNSMHALECLDLSETDLTAMPDKALAFYQNMGLSTNYTLKKIVLPKNVTTIGNSVFAMCAALESLELPQSVTTLGKWMFEGCEKLTKMIIPAQVTTIAQSAFYGFSGLQSIIIPSTVTTIANYAFVNCNSLKTITIPQTVTTFGDEVFGNSANLETAIINANITSLTATFLRCKNLKNVTLPSTLTTIGFSAFSECTSLEEIELPEGVITVGERAFSGCTKLRDVFVGQNVTTFGANAFSSCESLLAFGFPYGVTTIPNNIFMGCRRLKIVNIDGSVTSIGNNAFMGSAIKTITLPESVISIGQNAFTGCSDLTTIVCKSTSVPTATNSFTNINNLNNRGVVLMVPAAQVDAYKAAWGSSFPAGVEAKY